MLRGHLWGGHRKLIAQMIQAVVVTAIFSVLGLPTEAAIINPARGPPELF